jgi:muramoyltetrapeptide carboxypeptidase
MTQFGEYPQPLEYTIKYFNKAVIEGNIGKVEPSDEWTDEILNWFDKKDLERARKKEKNKGYEWLRDGSVKGKIIGGCLSSITHLLGTKYWPDHKDSILFIELPEGPEFDKGTPLDVVDSLLADLELAGIFKEIKGLIVGRPFKYSKEDNKKFKELLLDNTSGCKFPILYGADIGHTDPQITIPLGLEVRINSKENLFEFKS